MTTVAYRDGVMAADCGCFSDGLYQGEVDKLWVLPSVGLVGCCGEIGAMVRVVEWLKGGVDRGKKPSLPDDCDFEAIVVDPQGEVSHYDLHLSPMRVTNEFHVIGSGRKLALGAMVAGASAEKAVQIACQYDGRSREPVKTIRLQDLTGQASG